MNKGFTLIETVIAIAIMGMMLSMFAMTFVQATRSEAISIDRLEALNIARKQTETVGTYTYGSAQLSYGSHSFTGGTYTVTTNAQYPSSVKDVSVVVSWVNQQRTITSTITLATSISTALHQ